jgi:hypothetical protein
MEADDVVNETIMKSIRSYATAGSKNIVDSIRNKALSDIFDVLLVSVGYARNGQEPSRSSSNGDSNTEQDDEHSSHGMLDTSLALPEMLKPRELSEVITKVLKEHQPGVMSRSAFIAIISKAISSASCPPLNYLLSAPYTAGCRARSSQMQPTGNSQRKIDGLTFPSRSVSEQYLTGRNKFMKGNNVSHSELIYACTSVF